MQEDQLQDVLVSHYDFLSQNGILDYINILKKDIGEQQILIQVLGELLQKESVEDTIDFVIAQLLDRFIPSHMAFILRKNNSNTDAEVLCFNNMKPVDPLFDVPNLEPYNQFFSKYPGTISFELFEYNLNDPLLTQRFLPLHPEIIVPINGLGGLYGFIIFGSKILNEEYTQNEIRYLDLLMRFTGIGLQNNIHYTSATTDYKTQLYNHSFFLQRLKEELAKIHRHEGSVSIVMLDVDHFKKFNDTYGHLAGDKVLANIARVLRNTIRVEDLAARFGGEEFSIMLIETSKAEAWEIAERIRRGIENASIYYEGQQLQVTASIGIRHVDMNTMADTKHLIGQADEALYKSKGSGRNRVSMYQGGLFFRTQQLKERYS